MDGANTKKPTITTLTREEVEEWERRTNDPLDILEIDDQRKILSALRVLLADRDRLERARDEAEREIAKLVAFFRSPEGYGRFGWEGDVEGLSPAETAIKAMRGYAAALARIAELEAETVYLRKQWENAEAALAECKGQNEWLDRQLTLALAPEETKP
jgi:hypothetical protein